MLTPACKGRIVMMPSPAGGALVSVEVKLYVFVTLLKEGVGETPTPIWTMQIGVLSG
jgi:hypothetical protein